jgi:hypothetical protein
VSTRPGAAVGDGDGDGEAEGVTDGEGVTDRDGFGWGGFVAGADVVTGADEAGTAAGGAVRLHAPSSPASRTAHAFDLIRASTSS